MHKAILGNAVGSIRVGVEDYQTGSRERLVSAMRNIFSGILLLYKSRLSELSPVGSDEVLIRATVRPRLLADGSTGWVGAGRKTVDVQQIVERLEGLGIPVDRRALERIQRRRNDLEHYHLADTSDDALRGLLAESFVLIRDFCEQQLGRKTVELLGASTYGILSQVNEFYRSEQALCRAEIAGLPGVGALVRKALTDWTCERCGSGLLSVSDRAERAFICKSCSAPYAYEAIVPTALTQHNAGIAYMSKGTDADVIECPFCAQFAYVLEENACALCGESAENECKVCGMEIVPEELCDDGLCGWCRHMIAKGEKE